MRPLTRRQVLALGGAAGIVGLAGSRPSYTPTEECPVSPTGRDRTVPTLDETRRSPPAPIDVRGAIYIPARAFTLYQMWRDYDPAIVERDFEYATRVNLNAIRTWLSYEAWTADPRAHELALDHFLDAADARGLSVLLGIFDGVGQDPTAERLTNTDPVTATGTSSPPTAILRNPSRWDRASAFVEWVRDVYGDDDRLLGIEVMNEPGWHQATKAFAREMFATLTVRPTSVPLTVGSTSIANNTEYAEWGSDILQFHYNFPRDPATYWEMLRQATVLADVLDEPLWLTEWQRARRGRGFTTEPPDAQKTPDYASLAPLVHEAGLGNFFWSLMVKPGYVQPQRKNGVLGGLFHEDGAVWSLDDARAIKAMSGDPHYEGDERQEWPAWANEVHAR